MRSVRPSVCLSVPYFSSSTTMSFRGYVCYRTPIGQNTSLQLAASRTHRSVWPYDHRKLIHEAFTRCQHHRQSSVWAADLQHSYTVCRQPLSTFHRRCRGEFAYRFAVIRATPRSLFTCETIVLPMSPKYSHSEHRSVSLLFPTYTSHLAENVPLSIAVVAGTVSLIGAPVGAKQR